MSGLCWRLRWWVILTWAVTGASAVRADEVADQRDAWISSQLTLLRARARLQALQEENAALEGARPVPAPPRGGPPLEAGKILREKSLILPKKRGEAEAFLGEEVKRLENTAGKIEERWKEAAGRFLSARQEKARMEARVQGPLGQPAATWPAGADARRLALWALLAVLASVCLAAGVSFRPRVPRWQRRSLKTRLLRGFVFVLCGGATLGLAGGLALGLLNEGEPLIPSLTRAEELAPFLAQLSDEQDAARSDRDIADKHSKKIEYEVKDKREQWERAWQKRLGLDDLRVLQGRAALLIRELHTLACRNQFLAEDADRLASEALAGERILGDEQDLQAGPLARRDATRAGLYGALLLVVVLPWLGTRLLASALRAIDRRRCPRCLKSGALRPVPLGTAGPQTPAVRILACATCEYRLPWTKRSLHRLCFPTVGIVASGKTHWLVEFYHAVRARNLPPNLALARVPGGLVDRECDELIREIRDRQRGTSPTGIQPHVPLPLLFEFRESAEARDGTLVNLFDFNGEMTAVQRIDTSELRLRALRMDGFVFVLDPTKPEDRQREALEEFARELREVRDIPPGEPVPVPVAVCLTKLDLLPTRTLLRAGAFPWLERLRQLDRNPRNEAAIEARSVWVLQLLGVLFQKWNVVQTLTAQFGDNFRFFPLTPVGIDDGDEVLRKLPLPPPPPPPGTAPPPDPSLRERAYAPFGILEPVLWLMHLHGYRVFARGPL